MARRGESRAAGGNQIKRLPSAVRRLLYFSFPNSEFGEFEFETERHEWQGAGPGSAPVPALVRAARQAGVPPKRASRESAAAAGASIAVLNLAARAPVPQSAGVTRGAGGAAREMDGPVCNIHSLRLLHAAAVFGDRERGAASAWHGGKAAKAREGKASGCRRRLLPQRLRAAEGRSCGGVRTS